MSEEKKIAVLIDSDNVSAKHVQFILQEASKYGTLTYKRVYGDWGKGGNGWHYPAMNNALMPVQQTSYVAGKNATDFSMIIDAMDILYTSDVDGFVLVTSDSDFTRLAIRLREAGKLVIGIGEAKAPRAFTISCHHFIYVNQDSMASGAVDENALRRAVLDFVTESGDGVNLQKIMESIIARFGNIDFNEFGHKRFSNFIDSFPELRRSNTFVSIRKPRSAPPKAADSGAKPTEKELADAIADYLNEHGAQRDNMMKIESYLNTNFGKIDYSRFGSKRFARFVDKLDGFTRDGTNIAFADKTERQPVPAPAEKPPAEPSAAVSADEFEQDVKAYARDNMPDGGNAGQLNNLLIGKFGKSYFKALGFDDFKKAVESVPTVTLDSNRVYISPAQSENADGQERADVGAVTDAIVRYAYVNMPNGGNIGQLNNELIERFGRSYCEDLGFADYKSLLNAAAGIKVRRNFVYLTDSKFAEMVDAQAAADTARDEPSAAVAQTEEPAAEAAEKQPDLSEPQTEELLPAETERKEQTAEKPEINAVRRDILFHCANEEGGILMSQLGNLLSDKYGKGYLKTLGYSTIKRLAADMKGVTINNDRLSINEEFARRTEEIESFVNEFARGEGSHSVKALSSQLKKRFEGFDISDYGFARVTDFINAIDGVRAQRYYIVPDSPDSNN